MHTKTKLAAASWITILSGVWLLIAPFILQYANSTARINDIWLGLIIGLIALSSIRWMKTAMVIVGSWLILASFILDYTGTLAQQNDLVVGVIIILVSLWSA
jgi:hypothetical protein